MQTGGNAAVGQSENWGTEGLSDLLKVTHMDMHEQGKTETLSTNTATAQTPTRHKDSSFPTIFYFPKCLSGSCNIRISKGHVMFRLYTA